MLFNSIPFLVFLPTFLVPYWATRGPLRLGLTLVASYVFYAWWDWRLLPLLWFQTGVAFLAARYMQRLSGPVERRRVLVLGLAANLAVLGVFKYLHFGVESLRATLGLVGVQTPDIPWHVVLPIGISFYTFQCMGYLLDVYRRQVEPETSLPRFAASVGLFVHVLAGPIVRARNLLPQLRSDRRFDLELASEGFQQVLWGFFKKVVVADSLTALVSPFFAVPGVHDGASLLLSVYLYSFQIYCDFSGYSDIALGCAKILGYDLGVNFDRPYFARGFGEFWARWHISLSSWLRDYLFLPVAYGLSRRIESDRPLGVRAETWSYAGAAMVTMLLAGLWHGAAWTFVAWGGLHGVFLVLEHWLGPGLRQTGRRLRLPPRLVTLASWLIVFHAVTFAWIFFRAPSFSAAADMIIGIATRAPFAFGAVQHRFLIARALLVVGIVVGVEALSFRPGLFQRLGRQPALRFATAALMLWCIALFGTFSGANFIYFQF
jgi:D-alanyl-lipoteichoic acid acyltransferase DltB (MBOAT superfamily)